MNPAGAEALKTAEKTDSLALEVGSRQELSFARTRINTLLDTFARQKLAKPSIIQQYRQAAEQDKSLEGLKGFYHWIVEKWQESTRHLNGLQGEIGQAVQQGIINERDRAFLMKELILTDKDDFVGQAREIETILRNSLKKRRGERKEYDELRHHPLVRNTGFLRLDSQTKINIPDEKGFMALFTPERRKLLKKAKAALPQATEYAKKAGDEKSADLIQKYDKLLVEARTKRRTIGGVTEDKYRDGFKKISRQDKEEWLSGFSAEMQRYETLWKDIRKTLKGLALDAMEAKRDTLGYTGLFTEFGRVRAEESGNICTAYDTKLQKLQADRIISLHTRLSFSRDIREQPLPEQQRYAEKLEHEMEPYRRLRSDIDSLKNKGARTKLNALYQSPFHGLTEIRQEYLQLTGQAPASSTSALADQQDLQNIRRDRVRKQVVKSAELLDTREKKERMIDRLNQLLRREDQTHYDQSDYLTHVDTLRRERQKHEQRELPKPSLWSRVLGRKPAAPAEEPSPEAPAASPLDQAQSVASLRAQNRRLEASSEPGVSVTTRADQGFSKAQVTVGEKNRKVVRLDIGNREAVDYFLREDVQLESGRDTIDLMAKEGSETERMHLQDVLYFRNILRQELFEQKEAA